MRRNIIAGALGLGLLAGGCSHGPGVVGHWRGTWRNPGVGGGAAQAIEATYRADGTAATTMQTPFGPARAALTYAVNGDRLTQTLTGGDLDGQPVRASGAVPAEVYRYRLDGDALTLTRWDTPTTITLRRQ